MPETLNPRLVNGVHFVISKADSDLWHIGRTLIAKIMVLSEMYYYEFYAERLTNAQIVKAPYGPIPHRFSDCLDALEAGGKIRRLESSDPVNFPGLVMYESIADYDSSWFSTKALDMMSAITKVVGVNFTARKMTEWMHESIIWQVANMGEELPFAGMLSAKVLPPESEDLEQILFDLSQPDSIINLDSHYE